MYVGNVPIVHRYQLHPDVWCGVLVKSVLGII
jgi:hypothetical protein